MGGGRGMPLEDFLRGRDREPRAVVTSVSVLRPRDPQAFRFLKVSRVKPKGISVMSIAAHLPLSGGRVSQARIAYGGHGADAHPRARRSSARSRARPSTQAGIAPALALADRAARSADRCAGFGLVPAGGGARAPARACCSAAETRTQAMAKKPIQFRHNGRDQAVFVEDGANLLDTLRRGVGDLAPKYGCGQGTCGVCTVLVDGEPQLACLTLAETVEGRAVETTSGLANGPTLHPLQQSFMDNFAAQCGFCTPGMLMAAKALLDRNPGAHPQRGGRGHLGQHLPLHRLRADHQRHPGRLGPHGGPARSVEEEAVIEFRKDLFADERDDNLNEIGKPTQRQDMVGPRHRAARPISTTICSRACCTSNACARRTITRASARSTSPRPSAPRASPA